MEDCNIMKYTKDEEYGSESDWGLVEVKMVDGMLCMLCGSQLVEKRYEITSFDGDYVGTATLKRCTRRYCGYLCDLTYETEDSDE
jgi:hypothetical protein